MKYIMFSKFSNQFKLDILIFSCPSRFNHESNHMKQKMTKPPLDWLEFEVISLTLTPKIIPWSLKKPKMTPKNRSKLKVRIEGGIENVFNFTPTPKITHWSPKKPKRPQNWVKIKSQNSREQWKQKLFIYMSRPQKSVGTCERNQTRKMAH